MLPLNGRGHVLNGYPILIVEDDELVAASLADAVVAQQGRAIGPVATVAEGLELLATEHIAAAIVDANLLDRNVTPLALALLDAQIPFVVYTGTGLPGELADLRLDLPVILKPESPRKVIATLLDRATPDRGPVG